MYVNVLLTICVFAALSLTKLQLLLLSCWSLNFNMIAGTVKVHQRLPANGSPPGRTSDGKRLGLELHQTNLQRHPQLDYRTSTTPNQTPARTTIIFSIVFPIIKLVISPLYWSTTTLELSVFESFWRTLNPVIFSTMLTFNKKIFINYEFFF